MTTGVTAALAIGAALAVASAIGWTINRRSGTLRASNVAADTESRPDTSGLGLSTTGPTVLHFSAPWCGPCSAVRRVVDQVCADLPEVTHVEIDMDADPAAAHRLSVLSLPTTFIFDAEGQQRFRTAGVPSAADLRVALAGLLG